MMIAPGSSIPAPAPDVRPLRNQPIRQLRDWLDRLAETKRLAVARPGVRLKFELAAIAKRLDGERATYFPAPEGHAVDVISGLLSNRDWMAEAMGVAPAELLTRFQDAVRAPIPWRETRDAPVQEIVHREVDLNSL